MKIIITTARSIMTLLFIAFFIGFQAKADTPVNDSDILQSDEVTFVEAIKEISVKFDVFFTFDLKLVEGILVDEAFRELPTVESAVEYVLQETNLKYRIIDTQYVIIYKEDAEGIESLKEMSRHLIGLIDEGEKAVKMAPARKEKVVSRLAPRRLNKPIAPIAFSVEGTVVDQDGEPLIGVNIQVKGTNKGTATDFEGNFILEDIDENAVLVVSYIGYQTQEVPVAGKSTLNITMVSDSKLLDEVVVVGYTKKEKGELTGSVSTINGASIEQASDVNILQAMQGKLPGLVINNRGGEPGSESVQYSIRGLSTMGNNSPLIIIDGVPRESFSQLSPNDIENISILKDASAAIYGARAANGVINITTKRGSKAGGNEIRLSTNYGISSFTRVPEMMNSYQWAIYKNEIESRYGRQPLFTEEQIQKYKGGGELPRYPNTDMYEETFRDWAPEMHHNISSRGGNEKLQYYVSGDYVDQEGLYRSKDLKYKQYQMRSNIDANVTNTLSIGLDISAGLEKSHKPAYSGARLFSLVQRSKPIEVGFFDNGLPGFAGEQGANPVILSSDAAGWDDANNKRFQSKISLNLKMDWLTKGLDLTSYGSFDFQDNNNEGFHNIWTYYTYDLTNDEYVPNVGYEWQVGATRWLQPTENRRQETFYHIRLNYDRSFGNHNVEGFVAYEQEEGESNFLSAYRKDLISDKKIGLWAGGSEAVNNNSSQSEWGRQNYFGSLSYNFLRKYLVDITMRYDGSSTFADGGKFGVFPGLSLGWNLADENFMASMDNWLDEFKLRFSIAKMGNDRIPGFQYLNEFKLNSYYIFGVDPRRVEGFANTNVPNPGITWEESNMKNVGFDAILWNGSFSMGLDFFKEKRRQILIKRNASVPDYTALELPDENLGKVNNQGIELNLNHTAKFGEFSYSVGGNMTYNKSKIVFMDEAQNVSEYRKQEGFPLQSWVVYKTDGIYRTQQEIESTPHLPGTLPGDIKYIDLDGDNKISGNDRYRRYTSPIPEFQFGFNMNIFYKGIGLNAFFQGQGKAETLLLFDDLGNRPLFQFEDRWTENKKDSPLPRAIDRNDTYNAKDSDFWIKNASFLRLRNLVVSYSIPSRILQNIRINDLKISLKGSNLLTMDYIKYVDPEVRNSQARYYPQLKKLYLGIELKF